MEKKVLIVELLSFVAVLVAIEAVEKKLNIKFQRPRTYDDYLKKLQLITGKSLYDIFRIAADETGIKFGDRKIINDLNTYFETQGQLPHYLIKFLKEGEPYLDKFF